MKPEAELSYFNFIVNSDGSIHLHVSCWVMVLLLIVAIGIGVVVLWRNGFFAGLRDGTFEISQTDLGIGDSVISLSPNHVDKQIAYKIWVELSTRKLGLNIDLEHDVIAEIYDSWYAFFGITRELIKDVPVQRFRREGTSRIIKLSIDVLNLGVRPHLTTWQARYRRWYESEIDNPGNEKLSLQEIQKRFPEYAALSLDLKKVNQQLMNYRQSLLNLISS